MINDYIGATFVVTVTTPKGKRMQLVMKLEATRAVPADWHSDHGGPTDAICQFMTQPLAELIIDEELAVLESKLAGQQGDLH